MTANETDALLLDLRGLKCPLPVLKARKALQPLPAGAIVIAETTDPAAQIDFPHFCAEAGHELIKSANEDDVFRFTIRKGGA